MQIVPLSSAANQSLTVSLSVDGGVVTLQLAISYSEIAKYWRMDIADRNGNALALGIPLLCGAWPAANLLKQFGYLKIGSAFILNVSNSPLDSPDATSLGSAFILLWDDTAV